MLLHHAKMQIALSGEHLGMLQMRKHASWYLSGFAGAARLRDRINAVETYAQLDNLFIDSFHSVNYNYDMM